VTAVQANLKRALIESSDKVILLTEIGKFSIDSIRIFADFSLIDTVIVDEPLNNPAMKKPCGKIMWTDHFRREA
jgi:DeoR/GlpR family transcriptional regulator of sugar metabolism